MDKKDSEHSQKTSGHDKHKRDENVRTKVVTMGKVKDDTQILGGELKFSKKPAFLAERVTYWDELYAKQTKVYEGKCKDTHIFKNTIKILSYFYIGFAHEKISITMPDGAVKEGVSFETSPFDIAKAISKQFAEKIIVAKVKYTRRVATLDEGLLNPEAEAGVKEDDQWFFWDVSRKLEGDCLLKLFKFEDSEGRETFWHSSAHVLGQTMENEYGV